MAPSFPSERKRVESAWDRSPDLRLLQPPSQKRAREARLQWLSGNFRWRRKYPGWFPTLAETTDLRAGALTVAGQWRNFTAFPSILAIAVVNCAALQGSSRDAMEQLSMTSTFIAAWRREVKAAAVEKT